MQTAQIWKSIEALNNEAEAALKNNSPAITVIKSAPPPAFLSERKIELSKFTVLKSNQIPPTATLNNKHQNDNSTINAPLSSSSMDAIAAAIDRASKAPKTTLIDQGITQISDDFRQDLLTEVERAVRVVLAAELPQLVRYAVSVSIHELVTTPKGPKGRKTKADNTKPVAGTKQKKL
ncbi:hypothetical protein N8500_00545 [Candidatus Puniceispirillum sp.]|nr:hypothetical protein [Candidatus Puniceispirillum sp.]